MMIVPLFLRKNLPGVLLEKSAKITRQPQPSCYSRFTPDKGCKTCCAMTRRDFVMLCIFTTQKTLRENAQPYRFWGLLGSQLGLVGSALTLLLVAGLWPFYAWALPRIARPRDKD